MTDSLLSAALIVKDEARALPGCLAALAALGGLVERVVVYDTGSTDGTQRIAREAGAVLHQGHWDGDFARARNAAIEAAGGRWVLIVDADERVAADPGRLRAVLESGLAPGSELDALVVPMVNQAPDGGELYAAGQIRIFRPDRARYVGRVHERVEPLAPARSLRLAEQGREVVAVHHLGYCDPDLVAAKARRNLELVDAELAALRASPDPDPDQLARLLYHRGRTLLSAGQVSAALEDLNRLRDLPVAAPERVWGGDVLAQLLLGLGRVEQVPALVDQLRAAGVDGRYCDWLLARTHLAGERYDAALPLLRGIDTLVDAVGRRLDLSPVVQAQLIAAGRVGEVDEAAACCIRLMAGFGQAEGLGPLLLTLWGSRPAGWLVDLFRGADGGHLAAVAAELDGCPAPGPEVAAALAAS